MRYTWMLPCAVLGGVEQTELVEDDVDGPEVHGDVVDPQQQHMFAWCAVEEGQPQHRAGEQIERTGGLTADPLVQVGLPARRDRPAVPARPARASKLTP